MKQRLINILALLLTVVTAATATTLIPPLKGELSLSANFGELRPNHFHSGVDFKTGGETGKPILAVADGYVSAVEVSPWGFGRAIYITHPSLGLVTVYGHLESFAPKIDRVVRQAQYTRETFDIELEWGPEMFPVKAGDEIGKSGNAGSSGGPHLHFDVRDLATGDPTDPLPYYKNLIRDTSRPYWSQLYLYPDRNRGLVNDNYSAAALGTGSEKVFTAWGRVFPAIKCNDAMDGNSNIYGVKTLLLTVDGQRVMGRVIDRFSLDYTRAINTLVDYGRLLNGGGWAEWSHIPLTAPLAGLTGFTPAYGAVNINQERDYKCKWTMIDEHGNRTEVDFIIRGKKPETMPPYKPEGTLSRQGGYNSFHLPGLFLELGRDALADDTEVSVTSTKSTSDRIISDIYQFSTGRFPLINPATLTLRLPDSADSAHACIVSVSGESISGIDSKIIGKNIVASISRPGRYAIAIDTRAPAIENVAADGDRGYLAWRITDDISGVKSYRVTIDDKWALAELDGKNNLVEFKMDSSRFTREATHTAVITVIDGVGNTSRSEVQFRW